MLALINNPLNVMCKFTYTMNRINIKMTSNHKSRNFDRDRTGLTHAETVKYTNVLNPVDQLPTLSEELLCTKTPFSHYHEYHQ